MKLLIVTTLLIALSSAQTVNYRGANWLPCDTSDDCGGGIAGAYCDEGKCLVCPAIGCGQANGIGGYVQDAIECSRICESANARISCTSDDQGTVCNDDDRLPKGGFCNVRA